MRSDLLISKTMEALALQKTYECTRKLNGSSKANCSICLAHWYNDTLKTLYEKKVSTC